MPDILEARMEVGTYVTGLPQREIRLYKEADSLFEILRGYKTENGQLPILATHTITNPQVQGYDPPLPKNQFYVAFRKEAEEAGLRDREKLSRYVDDINSTIINYLKEHVPNVVVVNEGTYTLSGRSHWQGVFTREGNTNKTLTESIMDPRIEGKVKYLDCQSSFIVPDSNRKVENDITLGSVTYLMKDAYPMLIAIGIYIDSPKVRAKEKKLGVSSSIAVESGKEINKEQIRRDIARLILPFA